MTTATLNSVDEIDARRTELATEARTMLDEATTDLEGETLTRYEAIEAELTGLQTRRDRLERLERHMTAGNGINGANTPGFQVQRRQEDPYAIEDRRLHGTEVKARALTAIECTVHLADAYKTRATEILETTDLVDGRVARHIVVTGRPEYRTAFQKLASGNEWSITSEERQAVEEVRAASLTGSAGGFAIPFTLDPTFILTNAGTVNPWRRIARQVSIATNSWNGVTSAGITAGWAAEAAEATDNAPTLAQPSIPVYKADMFVPFSIEIGMDWAAIETDLRDAFADGKDRLEGTAFATGTGTGQPTGLVTALVAAATPVITSAAAQVFAVADVYATLEKVPPRHRSMATWVANLSTLNRVRQFGTANNYSGFTVDLTADGIPKLLGRPLYESSDLDGTITAAAANYMLVCGNFDRYLIVDRLGMTVELLPNLVGTNRRPTGQRGLFAYWRVGANCTDPTAFAVLNVT